MGENGLLIRIQSNALSPYKIPITDSYKFNWINVYILYKDSFTNYPNLDIKYLIDGNYKFTNEQLNKISKSNIRLYLSYNQVMELKQNNEEFYILDEKNLRAVMARVGIQLGVLNNNQLFFSVKKRKKDIDYILYFPGVKGQFLSIKFYQEMLYTKLIFDGKIKNTINNNENIIQNQFNKNMEIIYIIIFLYANEKDIYSFYLNGANNLINYYLVDKSYIDKFKEIYFYKKICDIPMIKGIKTLNDCLRNIKAYESNLDINNIYNKIKLNNFEFLNLNLNLTTRKIVLENNNQFEFPSNFIIIRKEILDLLLNFTNFGINRGYEILFGKSSLCLRWRDDLYRIYIYNYTSEKVFNLISIIELFDDFSNNIFERLSLMTFDIFLKEKNINSNIANQRQNLIDNFSLLGYIYLIQERINRFEKISERGRCKSNNKHEKLNFNTLFNLPNNPPRQRTPSKIILKAIPKKVNLSPYNETSSKIIKILILLYGNSKEINRFYNQGIFNVQNYYIINRDWLEKFKEIYQYNKICTIVSKKSFQTFNEYLNNLQNLLYSDEIKSNFSNINTNNFALSAYDLLPYEHQINEYRYITNFMIIHGSILNLIKSLNNFEISQQYEINFGISSLCLRTNSDIYKVLIYNYNNNAFNLVGIIELFDNYWKNIYNRYLSKKTFDQYLFDKKINANIINQKHNLMSSQNIHMGYIYLTKNIRHDVQPSNLIIDILILLYGNEKELEQLYNKKNFCLKNYYLVNKDWVNKFKQLYHYNEIYNALSNLGIQTYKYCYDNLKYLESLDEINTISNSINNIDKYALSEINISTLIKNIINNEEEFHPPINFQIINDSLYNLMINFVGNITNLKYDLTIYKSNLYIQKEETPTIVFVYEYNNISVNLLGIIKFDYDYFPGIYETYFSKINFSEYLIRKNINLNLINQEQILLSSKEEYLGYIYLITQIIPNDFNSIYQKLIQALNNLEYNAYDLPNFMDIKNYFQDNLIIHLPVYIINNDKLNYLPLSEYDILSDTQLDESLKYSFINEEICKYFKMQNINKLPKAFFFKINNDSKTNFYIFFPNQNCLLNVLNYKNNSFNLKKVVQQNQVPLIVNSANKHAKGLDNKVAVSYMNSTLQCLCHIKEIKNYFLDDNIYHQEILAKDNSLSKSFAEVLRNIWSQTDEISYNHQAFINLIYMKNPQFRINKNKNAKDLLLLIFDSIHDELNNPIDINNEINLNNIPKDIYEFKQNYYSQNYSIISKLFFYEKCNTLKCECCNGTISKYNSYNIIEFPLKEVKLYMQNKNFNGSEIINLEGCFEHSEQIEIFNGSNNLYCNRCCKNTTFYSSNKLYTCPEILTIVLNHDKGFNLNIQFSLQENISINKFVINKTCNSNYELISVIVLQKINNMSFHYLAFCKSPIDNEWYIYNDSNVTPCLNNIINEIQLKYIPYILFYQKCKKENINVTYSITFLHEGKRAFYKFNNSNKLLYEAYNEFKNNYLWAPKYANLFLKDGNNYISLDFNKSLHDNGIKDGDILLISNDND